MSLLIEQLSGRLAGNLTRWGCDHSPENVLSLDLSGLAACAAAVKKECGKVGLPPLPPRQERINALHRLRSTPDQLTARDWRLICWGLADECGQAGRPLDDRLLFPRIIEHIEREVAEGSIGRKVWLGLVYSYFAYRPDGGVARQHWLLLRTQIADAFRQMCHGRQRESEWIVQIGQHQDLFTDEAGASLGEAMFEGRQQEVDALQDVLQFPADSWLWHSMLAAQLKRIVTLDDTAFVAKIGGMLDWMEGRPQAVDVILSSLLTRYQASIQLKHVPHQRLRAASLAAWGNPQIGSQRGRWAVCVLEPVSQMVVRWFAKEDLETFFKLLQGEQAVDDVRLKYWLRYVGQMSFTKVLMGSETFDNPASDFVEYRSKNKGRYGQLSGVGANRNNAFLMQIGNYVFVEFSEIGACYFYPNAQLPFNPASSRLDLNSDIKVRLPVSLSELRENRIGHLPKDRWMDKFDRSFAELGVYPDDYRGGRKQPAANVDINPGRIVAAKRMAASEGAGLPSGKSKVDEAIAHFKVVAKNYGFRYRCEDLRSKGGAFWCYPQGQGSSLGQLLKAHGFKHHPGRGYWIK